MPKENSSSVLIPESTIKWVAVALIAMNIFSFSFGVFLAPALGWTSAPIVPGAGGDSQGPAGRAELKEIDALSIGSEDAPIVIVEYSDLQCPFCRRFFETTYPELKSEYIDTGKVRMEFRHFPLSFHPAAPVAAEAVECAREQNKGWEVHDIIFTKQSLQGVNTVEFSDVDIKEWIKDVPGLDVARVAECMDSDKYRSRVQNDFNDGVAAGVEGTPSFYIGTYEDGFVQLVGAQPFVAFEQVIEQELKN